MTSVLTPTPPGPPTAAISAATAGEGATSDAGTAAADFSGILLAMLPLTVSASAIEASGGELRTFGKTDKQGKSGDAEKQLEKAGDASAEDPAKTVPAVVIVPLPLLLQVIATPGDEGTEKDAGSEGAGGIAAPAPDGTGLLEALPETPAAPAIPVAAEVANTVLADAAPATALPKSEDVAVAAAAAAASRPTSRAAGADLAFAARLTTATANRQETGRSPQLHLGIPPETRSAGAAAQQAQPAEAASAETSGGPAGVRQVIDAGAQPAGQGDGALKTVPAAVPAEAAARIAPAEAETALPGASASLTAGETEAVRPEGSAATSAKDSPGTGAVVVQPGREHRGQESGADPGSEGAEQQRHSAESLFPAAVSAARTDAGSGKPESISREHATGAAASSGTVETQPSRPETPVQPVREISVLVPGRTAANGRPGPDVEVRVVERTGEMHVTVRTSDTQLSNSLRENLPQMVSELADRGYRAETWHPGVGPLEGGAVRTENAAAESGSDGGSRHSGRGGSDSPGQGGGQPGQRREQENAPEWLEALERSMGRADARTRSVL